MKLSLSAVYIFILSALICSGAQGEPVQYPLRIADNGRFFVDQKDKPFLIHGDTAWSLIVQLNIKETEFYLDTRYAQGFNSILVNLIEQKFSKDPPMNAFGEEPFRRASDISTPNEKYFAHADAVIAMAARKGILVFLVPAYLGWRGGDEGWYQVFKDNGRKRLRHYGRYVGNRYKHRPNIIWVLGGDFTPSRWYRWTVNEVAEGIREGGATQRITAHCGKESPANVFGNARWLDFNNVYSHADDIYRETIKEYGRRPIKPFILLESIYEGEHNATAERIRRQAYWSILTGGAGHFYGNNPVWNFGSPVKVFSSEMPWQQALNSRGAEDMSHLWDLFKELRWHELSPGKANGFIFVGHEGVLSEENMTCAASMDGNLMVVYLSDASQDPLKLNLNKSLPVVSAFWYDPTEGRKIILPKSQFLGKGKREYSRPGRNASGDKDWVFVLKAEKDSAGPE